MARVQLHPCFLVVGSLLILAVTASNTVAFQYVSTYNSKTAPRTKANTIVPATTLRPSTTSPFLNSYTATRQKYLQQQAHYSRSSSLCASANDSSSSSINNGEVDVDALIKYHASIVLQMGILFSLLTGLDYAVSSLLPTTATAADDSIAAVAPFWASCILFYGLSLKSRTFNPLDNTRPDLGKAVTSSMDDGQDQEPSSSDPTTTTTTGSKGFGDRVMPSWTPPGIIFPIMWVLIIGPTRAYTASLVYTSTGHFADPAILALLFHLSVGDVWNTINNTEKRFGAAVTGVVCVSLANANVTFQFYQADQKAGMLLAATMVWFTVASALIIQTWRLNPVDGEELDKVYPVVGGGDVPTRFAWFAGESD